MTSGQSLREPMFIPTASTLPMKRLHTKPGLVISKQLRERISTGHQHICRVGAATAQQEHLPDGPARSTRIWIWATHFGEALVDKVTHRSIDVPSHELPDPALAISAFQALQRAGALEAEPWRSRRSHASGWEVSRFAAHRQRPIWARNPGVASFGPHCAGPLYTALQAGTLPTRGCSKSGGGDAHSTDPSGT